MSAGLASFIAEFERLASPSQVCTRRDLDVCLRLGTALVHTLRGRGTRLVHDNVEKPVMQVYQSDGWGSTISGKFFQEVDGKRVLRHGRQRLEFMLERGIIRCHDAAGAPLKAMIFGPPRGLTAGRSSWHFFAGGADFMPLLRAQGHRGIALTVYLLDGGLFSSTWPKFRGLHQLWYRPEVCGLAAEEAWLLKQSEWVFGFQCRLHGTHNAVLWGLMPLKVGSLGDVAHEVLGALSRSSCLLHSSMQDFLRRHLCFVSNKLPADALRPFWAAMAISKDMLDLFCQVDPWWDPELQQLQVRGSLELAEDTWNKVAVVVLYCRRWLNWSDTRWARSCRAGQFFARAWGTGLKAQVEACLANPAVGHYTLEGAKKADERVVALLATAAAAALPFDNLCTQLLQDDRLILRAEELLQYVHAQMQEVLALPSIYWRRLAAMGGKQPHEHLHTVSLTMMVSFGYLWREVFADLLKAPLSLCRGDVEKNVEQLQRGEVPVTCAHLQRMKTLLDTGTPVEAVVAALKLLTDAPMSTMLTEEAHASAALVMRSHGQYTEKALRVKALLHSLRAAVRQPERAQQFGAKHLEKTLSKLKSKKPRRATARQLFLKAEMASLKRRGVGQQRLTKQQCQLLMAKHAQMFFNLPETVQRDFEQLAIQRSLLRKTEVTTQLDCCQVQQAWLHKRRGKESVREAGKNLVRQCRLTMAELEDAAAFFYSRPCQKLAMHGPVGAFGPAPTAPTLAEQTLIEVAGQEGPVPDGAWKAPWWLRALCRHRDHCQGTAVGLQADGQEWWMFLFGKQKPFQGTFLQLRRVDPVMDLRAGAHDVGSLPVHYRQYQYWPPVICFDSGVPFPTDSDFDIYWKPGLMFEQGGVSSVHAPVFLERMLGTLQPHGLAEKDSAPVGKSAKTKQKPATPASKAELLQANPWLSDSDLERPPAAARKRRTSSRSPARQSVGRHKAAPGDGPASGEAGQERSAGQASVAFAELREVRSQLHWSEDHTHFYTRIMGGAFTKKKTGEAADGCSGFPRGGKPTRWCDLYAFPKKRSFMFGKWGRAAATQMAREYCRRGEYFYNLFLNAGENEEFKYTASHVEAYVPGSDWLEFLRGCPDPVKAKAADLQAIRPRLD